MNKRLCTCVALFLAVPSLAPARPDDLPEPANSQRASVSSLERDREEGLIKLDVVVTDPAGNAVTGLRRADFKLTEEAQPQKILSFQEFHGNAQGSEAPVRIILLIDTIELPANLASEERNSVQKY